MTSNRSKGLAYIREVRKILEVHGHTCEGPGYAPMWTPKGMIACHRDYFDVWDLLSFTDTNGIHGHQVCTKDNKLRNVKKIQAVGLSGYLWVRLPGGKYDKYWVEKDKITIEEWEKDP